MLGPSLRVPNPLTSLATAVALTVALANTAHPAGAITPTPTRPTATPTALHTAMRVPPPRANDDDSCSIVAPGGSSAGGGLALLLAPALLLWARRRRL